MPAPRTGNINTMDDSGGGPVEWFRSLPFVTQYWFGSTVLCTVAGNMGVISPMKLVYDWSLIKGQFEIWRFFTCFCFAGGFSFPTLILLYICYNFSNLYETNIPFNTGAGGGSADYLWMWLLGAAGMILSQPLVSKVLPISSYIYTSNMIYMVLYVWSKRHPTAPVSVWGFPVKGMHLPFAYLGLAVFTGSDYMSMVHGILIGHIYYFLVDVTPQAYGKDFIHTPQFIIEQIGMGTYIPSGPINAAPSNNNSSGGTRTNWGSGGQRLGSTPSSSTNNNSSSTPVQRRSAPQQQQQQRSTPQPQSSRGHSWGGGQRLGSS